MSKQTNPSTTVIAVGKARLKRTLFHHKPIIMRIYMDEDTFNSISANGHYSGMTADEYARTVLIEHLKQA